MEKKIITERRRDPHGVASFFKRIQESLDDGWRFVDATKWSEMPSLFPVLTVWMCKGEAPAVEPVQDAEEQMENVVDDVADETVASQPEEKQNRPGRKPSKVGQYKK